MDWQSDCNDEAIRFAPTLERWYDHHKRDLPWRHTHNPYYIWLSEIILQQTRVVQGLPYYERFVTTYPKIEDLAQADERELLRLWQGLGYYSRARNLHLTAKLIVDEWGGRFPDNYTDLLKLKGIGTYTAAAVASFAFGERVPVVDGNVYRVLARVFGITEDITTNTAKKTFFRLAVELMAHAENPATYNQAIMEFGAIQCTPVSPDCLLCPVQQQCNAYQTGRQHKLPVKAKKAAVRERYFSYLVFRQGKRVAMRERTAKDIWQNLHDFYLVEEAGQPDRASKNTLQELTLPDEVRALVEAGTFAGLPYSSQQLLSHQRVLAQFYVIDLPETQTFQLPEGLHWYSGTEVEQLPKPALLTSYFERNLV